MRAASRPIVHLGPSLPRAEAERLLTAEYRSPARRGDLAAVDPGRTVLLVDGEFSPGEPIELDEIRSALRRGVIVHGAASTGAFAAARLRPEGMRGTGWVYGAYRQGRIATLDDVAILYRPDNFRSITVPIVGALHWLDRLRAKRAMDAAAAAAILSRLRAMPLEMRDRTTIVRTAAEVLAGFGLDTARLGDVPLHDIKAEDTRELLTRANASRSP